MPMPSYDPRRAFSRTPNLRRPAIRDENAVGGVCCGALQASKDVLTLPLGDGEVRSPIGNSRPSPRRVWWPPQRWREPHNLTAHFGKGAPWSTSAKMRFGQTSWAHQEWEDTAPRTVHSLVSTMVLYWIPLAFSWRQREYKIRVHRTELQPP